MDSPALISIAAIASLGALSCALVFAAIYSFRTAISTPDRTYMDPLPWQLRVIWPLVLFCAHYFGRFLSTEAIERTHTSLMRGGWSYRMTPEQFLGLKLVSCLVVALAAGVVLWALDRAYPPLLVAIAVFGYWIPAWKLREVRKLRERHIIRMLPTYLDFITMAVEAGLSLSGALVQATANGPDGLFKQELARVNRDIKAGAGRVQALERMGERLDLRPVSGVIAAIAQAEKTGSDVGKTLRVQADQQRVDRFQRAEKLAMEAPVKLIFPLVAFIFPTTFIVLGFPILMKWLHGV